LELKKIFSFIIVKTCEYFNKFFKNIAFIFYFKFHLILVVKHII